MKYMHFAAMDRQSTSWQRADPEAALIETADTAQWTVALPDGNDAHTVTLFTDGINTRGHCTCDGYHYHDRCAHLITIRQAELLDVLTVDGEIVRIPDYELLDVDGATLVYSTVTEHRGHLGREVKIGRFLAGVADVTDRSKLRGELARLGHPVAEAHLLEEFDAEEVGREVNYHV